MKPGDLLLITRAASVQFIRPIRCRLIRIDDRPTYDGWVWLDVYQLDARDRAVARRSIFVQRAGIRPGEPARQSPQRATVRPRACTTGHNRIPPGS
ncbi:hypothetical protein [Micromonospora sp. WMMD714]|uniref:hypothetical protein n=1 Tax=Micromonospora sp. WMMD714 TaxID=3016097 RepID=UPI002499D64A|nr:hypothetical protein [Micromonospora sp. WMMD714]WFE64402.1 hypothetical protein O7625_14440 [Micromonospora sp. WMMD714]